MDPFLEDKNSQIVNFLSHSSSGPTDFGSGAFEILSSGTGSYSYPGTIETGFLICLKTNNPIPSDTNIAVGILDWATGPNSPSNFVRRAIYLLGNRGVSIPGSRYIWIVTRNRQKKVIMSSSILSNEPAGAITNILNKNGFVILIIKT